MEALEFSKNKSSENTYVPYTPPNVKAIMCNPNAGPPLISSDSEDTFTITTYNLPGFEHLNFKADILLEDIDGGWSIKTPLAMAKYVKPDKENIFNASVCNEASKTNAVREMHNKFIISIFKKFIINYDCGMSGGSITMPPPPEDAEFLRLESIKKLLSDKYSVAKSAIEYCAIYGYYCGKDYKFEDALEKANNVYFEQYIKSFEGGNTRVRVRIAGRPPCWWDGVSDFDDDGNRVKWKTGVGHTFLTPNIQIVENSIDDLQLLPV
jgi:hypothetical protein